MKRTTFKNSLGIYLITIHFSMALLAFLRFKPDGESRSQWLIATLVVIVPLFATFTTAILNFIFGNHPEDNTKERGAAIFTSFFICSIFGFLLGYTIWTESHEHTLKLEEYTATLGGIETVFGVYIGFIVKRIFETETAIKTDDRFIFIVPEGWTFKQSAEAICQADQKGCKFIGFSNTELSLKLRYGPMDVANAMEAIDSLKHLNDKLPDFTAVVQGAAYNITKKQG